MTKEETPQSLTQMFYNYSRSRKSFLFYSKYENMMDLLFFYYLFNNLSDKYNSNAYFGVDDNFGEFSLLPNVILKKQYSSDRIIQVDNIYSKLPFWEKNKIDNKYSFILDSTFPKIKTVSPHRLEAFYDKNEYSDIIGYDLDKLISDPDQCIITSEIYRCGLFPKKLPFSINMTLRNNTPKPLSVNINKTTRNDLSKFSVYIDNLSECKYFIGYYNEAFILASLILGIDNCILLFDNDIKPNSVFNIFKNSIEIFDKKYIPETIINKLEYLYTKDF